MALNIVCFPADRLEDLDNVIKGGVEKVKEAGAILVGGHSLKDQEPKYGLAVLGIVHPEKLIRNHTPQEGDSLILTKPLGTGIVSTALKKEFIEESEAHEAICWMSRLNDISDSVLKLSVHSMTDITGFGLLGHLSEMLEGENLFARLQVENVPLLGKAYGLSLQNMIPGGTKANQQTFSCAVKKIKELDWAEEILLYDAQTSGGLLISVGEEDTKEALNLLREQGFTASRVIGKIEKRTVEEKKIFLV